MPAPDPADVTRLVQRLADGESEVSDDLFPIVYERLRGLADSLLQREREDHTLQPTALVNEAYLKLAGGLSLTFEDRAHFAAVAARAMRQVLVDHARRKGSEKRGGGWARLTLDGLVHADAPSFEVDVEALDLALSNLSEVSERAAKVVELSFFGSLNAGQIASALDVTERTVGRDLKMGRAFLLRELDRGSATE